MARLIPLTAKKLDGQPFANPRVVYVQEDKLQITPPSVSTSPTKVVENLGDGKAVKSYLVYEDAAYIDVARDPTSAASSLYWKKFIQSALAGAGTTQGAGTAILSTTYLAEALTIGAAATEAFVLPAAVVGKVVVVVNNDVAGDAAKVFPAVGEYIGTQAVNTVLSIASGARKHFVCLVLGKWTIADDFGY